MGGKLSRLAGQEWNKPTAVDLLWCAVGKSEHRVPEHLPGEQVTAYERLADAGWLLLGAEGSSMVPLWKQAAVAAGSGGSRVQQQQAD